MDRYLFMYELQNNHNNNKYVAIVQFKLLVIENSNHKLKGKNHHMAFFFSLFFVRLVNFECLIFQNIFPYFRVSRFHSTYSINN